MYPQFTLLVACAAAFTTSGALPATPTPAVTAIQVPITGTEHYGNCSTPYHALVKFYAAFSASSNSMMETCWDPTEAVSNLNQLGGILRDRKDVLARYAAIFTSPLNVTAMFTDYVIQELGDSALVVGREMGSFQSNGTTVEFITRDTRFFRKDKEGVWKHMHHHGSFEDPEVLSVFQQASGLTVFSTG